MEFDSLEITTILLHFLSIFMVVSIFDMTISRDKNGIYFDQILFSQIDYISCFAITFINFNIIVIIKTKINYFTMDSYQPISKNSNKKIKHKL